MKKKSAGMTYKGSGVNYDAMDLLKVEAQKMSRQTLGNLKKLDSRFAFKPKIVEKSIGESASVCDVGTNLYIASVEEGLGTKNKVSEAMAELMETINLVLNILKEYSPLPMYFPEFDKKSLYFCPGQCTAAMIINDVITVGAQPIEMKMHLAARDDSWFANRECWEGILSGWKHACDLANCAWTGGETPTLLGIVESGTCLLSGSSWGMIPGKKMLHGSRIRAGDKIIFFPSSGVHANGLTLCRKIAQKLPMGLFSKLPSGQSYGQVLLEPTPIYSAALNKVLEKGADVHYAINITGHGLRKIMRADEPFRYVINKPAEPQEIFKFIMEKGPVDEREAYGNFNMGQGFALIVAKEDAELTLAAAAGTGMRGWTAGEVKTAKKKSVIIKRDGKKDIIFREDEMKIR